MSEHRVDETARRRRFSALCAFIVAGIGAAGMLGWMTVIPDLGWFGWGPLRMAPSTAIGFILNAAALLIVARTPSSRARSSAAAVIQTAVGFAALAALVLASLGVRFDVEHFMVDLRHAHGEPLIGHMAPVSAAFFVAAALSFLASLSDGPDRRWRSVAAWWIAAALTAASVVVVLSRAYGTPAVQTSVFAPPTSSSALGFMVLGAALVALARPEFGRSGRGSSSPPRAAAAALLAVFAVLALSIVVSGWLYGRQLRREFRGEAQDQLAAVADLKVGELVHWRTERLSDALVLGRTPDLGSVIGRYLRNPADAGARALIRSWLSAVQESKGYERAALVDRDGVARVWAPDSPAPPSHDLERVIAQMRTGRVDLLDFHRDPGQQEVHLAIVAPVFGERGEPIAALVLRIDPGKYLYPLIARWPVPSETAETLLVRREDGDVVFLNPLRLRSNTALDLRFPVTEERLPAAMAARGREGVVEGLDYRGVPVLACLRTVPDSPWALVARMDLVEVYAPLAKRIWTLASVVVLLVVAAGAMVGLLWSWQTAVFYRERSEAAEAVEYHRALLEETGRLAHVGGWEFDASTGEGTWTDEVAVIHGLDPGARANLQHGLSFYHDESRARIETAVRAAVELAQPYDLELELTTAAGHRKWVRTIGHPVIENGKVVSVRGSFQDISELKRAEDALGRLNEELEQRVLSRTAELENANRELEAFSYSVSHDLRAPLRGIDGWSLALLEDSRDRLDGQAQQYLDRIRAEAQRMGILIDQLLDLSRVGRAEVRTAIVNLSALARKACDHQQAENPARRVECVIEPGLVAQGDAVLLEVALANLLENAWKFTAPREPARIEVGRVESGGPGVFFVRDNGVGFDMRHATKLFGAFQRMHGVSEFPGTGIGLATVQRIIRRHGGRIWAEAEVGHGATFYFTLTEQHR